MKGMDVTVRNGFSRRDAWPGTERQTGLSPGKREMEDCSRQRPPVERAGTMASKRACKKTRTVGAKREKSRQWVGRPSLGQCG